MEPSGKDIQDLRSKFFKKLEDHTSTDPDPFHPADITKIKNNDDWLKRFLLHHENDQKEALNMLWETCDWRKKFGANDITEKNVDMSILEEGSIFAHNYDKDGKAMLIFKSKKHVKGAHDFEDLKRILVYWMERLENSESGGPITVFFDEEEAGLKNLDLDFTRFLIKCFQEYYPYFLNYILVFEMPWILNAAFKIIKTWLPPKAVQKIKFLNKSSLKDYVDADQALKSWGGRDDYMYIFEPTVKAVVHQPAAAHPAGDENKKKVHFADGSPVSDVPNDSGFIDTAAAVAGSTKLLITPSDVIIFNNDGNEMTGTVSLKNEDTIGVSYKIKTTSPEKYRVRPSTGTLAPGNSVTINVVLQSGYQIPGLSRDKFLILSIPVGKVELSPPELTELWKQSSGKEVEQHRLRCSMAIPTADSSLRNGSAFISSAPDDKLAKLSSDISKLNTNMSRLSGEMSMIQRQQWILMVGFLFLAIIVIYFTRNLTSVPADSHQQSCFVPPPDQQP